MFSLIIEQKLCVYPGVLTPLLLWRLSINFHLAGRLQHYKLHGILSDIQGRPSAVGGRGWRPVVHIRRDVAVLQKDDELHSSK